MEKINNTADLELENYVFSHGIVVRNAPINDNLMFNIDFATSDDFTNKHVGKHILFAGCSVTYGVGLPDVSKNWPRIVYETIKLNETTSGFYNIAFPGQSISLQVSLIFRYIEKYGKPDVIFFNLPSTSRTFSALDNMIYSSQVTLDQERDYPGSIAVAEYYNHEAYLYLHNYCKATGIKLISITWSYAPDVSSDPGVAEKLFNGKFDSFYKSKISIDEFLEDYLNKNKGDYLLLGSDGQHPGYGPHAYFALTALNAYYGI
jgi:hypothetical protein